MISDVRRRTSKEIMDYEWSSLTRLAQTRLLAKPRLTRWRCPGMTRGPHENFNIIYKLRLLFIPILTDSNRPI